VAATIATVALSLPAQEVYDYCKISEQSSLVDRALGNEEVVWSEITLGDKEGIRKQKIALEDILTYPKEEKINPCPPGGTVRIMLMPVGFEEIEIQESMEYAIKYLQSAYEGFKLDFVYVNKNIPIGIKNIERYSIISDNEELNLLDEKMNDILPTDKYIFVINSIEHMGSGSTGHAVLTYHKNELPPAQPLYRFIHEVAHMLGLGDGYRRYYPEGRRNGTELFVNKEKLDTNVKKGMELFGVKVGAIENATCQGNKIYRMYPDAWSIMRYSIADPDIVSMLEDNKSIFNPLQKYIMRDNIEHYIQNTPHCKKDFIDKAKEFIADMSYQAN